MMTVLLSALCICQRCMSCSALCRFSCAGCCGSGSGGGASGAAATASSSGWLDPVLWGLCLYDACPDCWHLGVFAGRAVRYTASCHGHPVDSSLVLSSLLQRDCHVRCLPVSPAGWPNSHSCSSSLLAVSFFVLPRVMQCSALDVHSVHLEQMIFASIVIPGHCL